MKHSNQLTYCRSIIIILLVLAFHNLSSEPKSGSEDKGSPRSSDKYFYKKDSSWNLSLYGGRYSETDLLPIVLRQDVKYRNSNIFVVGMSRPLDYKFRNLNFEVESNIGKHWGLMNHWEINGFFIARIQSPFQLPFSFAIGEGLSLASENPKLENKRSGIDWENFTYQTQSISSRNLLNYVMVELELGEPAGDWPRVFLRVHHRSGVFGLYCKPDPACGSNFITYGIRYPIDKLF